MTLRPLSRIRIVLVVVAVFGAWSGAQSAEQVNWRFPVGLTYVSGFKDVYDFYLDEYQGSKDFYFPVGIQFKPYVEFEHGSRIGMEIGPVGFIQITRHCYGYCSNYSDSKTTFWDIPVGASYGFTFVPRASVSPYARVGVRYHFGSGDLEKKRSAGLLAALGVDFLRTKRVGFGFEVAYDSSEVTFEHTTEVVAYDEFGDPYFVSTKQEKKIKPGKLMVGVHVTF